MNEIELFLTKLYDFCARNNRIITQDELYSYINKVKGFNTYDETLFYDICDYPEIYLRSYEDNRQLKDLDNDLYYYFSNNSNYKRIEVGYTNTVKTGARDNIKLYIPLESKGIVSGSKKIFEFLFNEKIPFIAKISKTKRLDGFIIRLFYKNDAIKLIDFCKNIDSLIDLNPFIPTINKIGIARDTYGMSYQYHLCKILSEYSNFCMNNINSEIFTVKHLKKYLDSKITDNLTDKEHFMNNAVITGINCVLNNTNVLDTFIDSYNIKYEVLDYEYDEINKSYTYDGLFITMNNNLRMYIKLQVNRLLSLLYKYKHGEVKEFILNEDIAAYISYIIDKENDSSDSIKLVHHIKDKEINKLIPFIYAYFGIEKRNFDSYKALDIIQIFK